MDERFAFYGTLRWEESGLDLLGVRAEVEYLGPCRVAGQLYLVDWYPGLAVGDGEVVADLCRVAAAAVPTIDGFEGFDPQDPTGSEFERVETELVDRPETAWVYRWCGDPDTATHIRSGDWAAFRGHGREGGG